MTPSAPRAALVIIGNGPGEVAGWAMPVAAEARRWAATQHRSLAITLCLPPCQGASGQERSVAASTGLFDTILDRWMTLRLGLGLSGWMPPARPILLHVGGDFWYARQLGRRWRARTFAFVERAHVARVHEVFEQIFVPTPDLQRRLLDLGVPAAKVLITGDPRNDGLAHHGARAAAPNGDRGRRTVTVLTGSRDAVFKAMLPFWVETVKALRTALPDAHLLMAVSPYVSPQVHQALLSRHRRALDAAGVEVGDGGWSGVLASDLVLTLPGSNTLELAASRIPTIVIAPPPFTRTIAFEGLTDWVARVPGVGLGLKMLRERWYVTRGLYAALPNMRAGRRIIPEFIGKITPERVAAESAWLLDDDAARQKLIQNLEAIPNEPGASRRIIEVISAAWAVS